MMHKNTTPLFDNPVCTIHQLRALAELMQEMGIVSISHDFSSKTNTEEGTINVKYLDHNSDEDTAIIWRKNQGSF